MAKKYDLHLKGYVGDRDFDADYVDFVLGRNESREVNVLIDSLGGSVATALSISSAFRNHGNVNVHFVGMNASAATIASLGAKHVSIDASAMYLVHKCSEFVCKCGQLNSDQLRLLIDECEQQKKDLDKIDLNIASMYAVKCKKDKEALLELMSVGGWLTAQEALDWGFVDCITEHHDDLAPSLDDATVKALASAGIPLPSMPTDEKAGFLRWLISLIGGNKTDKTKIVMTKHLKFLCELLQADALTSEDGKITLSDEQMQAVENRLAELDRQIAERDTQIEALKMTPAEESPTVVEDSKATSPADDYAGVLNEARKMFNSIP